jgi:hypothetical protein
VSLPIVLSLRQRVLCLCQCFYLSANSFVSSTIVFASSLTAGRLRPLSLSLRQRQGVSDHCLRFIDHGSDPSDHVLRVCYRSRLRWFPAVCGSPIASRKPAKDRGQGGSRLLSHETLSFFISCRCISAHSASPVYRLLRFLCLSGFDGFDFAGSLTFDRRALSKCGQYYRFEVRTINCPLMQYLYSGYSH